MSLLFETIKVFNRKLLNIPYHNERMNRSRRKLFSCSNDLDLAGLVEIPIDITNDIYKCKVIYSDDIQEIEWTRYTPRKIEHLKLAYCNEIDYSYKYLERSIFEKLLRENGCNENEDILIIKNGRVTDTSYSNIALFDGKEWSTPKHPLLKGTQRTKLIDEKKIIEQDIWLEELKHYQEIILINAMLEFDQREAKLVNEFIKT
ncbi:MAG: hypothetical protein A2455_09435 [Ignavibacteria bacterium RIFOXYC2_FULL_35_16]|nr:MAG: hypothetical protein A2455_09435 [Ignavibacteria bacterium RIFOXYC2_FULL_35_16]